jgi:hypothetical protein
MLKIKFEREYSGLFKFYNTYTRIWLYFFRGAREHADYSETKALGELRYKSKEAIFQYKDQKHFEDWENSIENLKDVSTTPILSEDLNKYSEISRDIVNIILTQNMTIADIEEHMKAYSGILEAADKRVQSLTAGINKSIEKTSKNLYYKFITITVLLAILFITGGIFIHLQFLKPLEILKNSTDELSKKILARR